jgi:hypothetical protein
VLHCNPAVKSVVVHSQTVRARRRARTLTKLPLAHWGGPGGGGYYIVG